MIALLPFTAFVPDGGKHGAGLDLVRGALPIHGSWRPIQKLAAISSQSGGPPTGAHVHMYLQSQAIQYMWPDGDLTSSGSWESTTGAALYTVIDESTADDADFLFALGAPSGATILCSLTNPGATSSTDHIMRWRYRIPVLTTSGWTVKAELMQGGTIVCTDTATGSAVTAWVQREYTLTAGDLAKITDYTDLRVRFTATAPGATQFARPTSDAATGGWTNQAGSGSNVWQSIDESSASDTDFAQSSTLTLGGAVATYEFALSSATDPLTNAGSILRYRLRGRNAGVQAVVRLKQGATTVATRTHTLTTSFVTQTIALTAAETALITDWTALKLSIEASYPTAATSSVSQSLVPASDTSNSGWSASSGSTLYTLLDEAGEDDSDLIFAAGVEATCILALTSGLAPTSTEAQVLRVRARRGTSGTAFVTVQLRQGSTVIREELLTLSSLTFANFDWTLTSTEMAAITDWTALNVRLDYDKVSSGTTQAQISVVRLTVPQPRRAELSWAELQVPASQRAEFSWWRLQLPDASTAYRGDVMTVFCGTRGSIYECNADSWRDRRAYAYASGAVPAGWSFCSIGNNVVATNRVNDVQLRLDNTGNFQDCITSATKPKARFCAAWRAYLLLGDINLSGYYSDEVWWSDLNNIRSFDTALPSESANLPVRSRPGQITGLVGGDFALIFKRNSLHALDWVGQPFIGRIRDVSGSIGSPWQRSIVEAEGRVYFWDGSCFRVTDGYSPPQRIGADILTAWLTDAAFSDSAIAQVDATTLLEEDQLITGWYDRAQGLIFWAYRASQDDPLLDAARHRRAVVYSPRDDRWSTIYLDAQELVVGTSAPNVTTSSLHLLKGTEAFTYNGTASTWARFSGGQTYEMLFRTKRQTLAMDDQGRPLLTTVRAIKPVFDILPQQATIPDVSITLRTAADPHFQRNVIEETYPRSKANEAGWFPHRMAGVWFELEMTIPVMSGITASAVKGCYLEYDIGGGRA